MRILPAGVAAVMLALAVPHPSLAADAKPVGPVQSLTVAEFLKLPDGPQAVFVGGVIEGMAFISYGYSLPDLERWTECVQRKTLGDTAADLKDFLQQNPAFNEGIASALAQTLGKRCKH